MVILMSESHRLYILSPLRLIMANQNHKLKSMLNEEEHYFMCRCINLYGSDMLGWISPENLTDSLVLIGLRAIDEASPDLTEEGHLIVSEIKRKIKEDEI